jgi:hypothetical protein
MILIAIPLLIIRLAAIIVRLNVEKILRKTGAGENSTADESAGQMKETPPLRLHHDGEAFLVSRIAIHRFPRPSLTSQSCIPIE